MRATLRLVVRLVVLIGIVVRVARIPISAILILHRGENLLASTIGSLANAVHPFVVVVYDRHRHIKRLARIKRYADH
jgi:hypothetical protein